MEVPIHGIEENLPLCGREGNCTEIVKRQMLTDEFVGTDV